MLIILLCINYFFQLYLDIPNHLYMKPPNIKLIISFFIFLSIFYCCVQKGTPFSFTTPEGEEVSLIIPPGFEDQRTANPWEKLDKDLKNYFSAYVCNADNPEGIMELYFNLREYSDINTKNGRENRRIGNYMIIQNIPTVILFAYYKSNIYPTRIYFLQG